MKKLIIFDLDGTILNTISDMKNSMNHLLSYLDAPLITDIDMKEGMNKGRRYLMENALGRKLGDEEHKKYQKIYNDYYFIHKNILTKPYEGVVDLLNQLKDEDYLLAVCSNKLHEATMGLINEILPNIFDYVIGSGKKFLRKPNTDMIIHILKTLKVSKERTIYIGDTEADIKASNNAKLFTIAALYGYGIKEQVLKHKPDEVANYPKEIYKIINTFFKEK